MTAEISLRHAAEIADAKHWHETAPTSKVMACAGCRQPRTFMKSRWKCGRYSCETCGYNIDERWKQGQS